MELELLIPSHNSSYSSPPHLSSPQLLASPGTLSVVSSPCLIVVTVSTISAHLPDAGDGSLLMSLHLVGSLSEHDESHLELCIYMSIPRPMLDIPPRLHVARRRKAINNNFFMPRCRWRLVAKSKCHASNRMVQAQNAMTLKWC